MWAHRGCRADLARGGAAQHAEALAWYRTQGRPGAVPLIEPVLPDRVVDTRAELDLGGRGVLFAHLGPGHTDHDLVVGVPDARVLFAGDLVEQGARPAFEDAHPLRWPTTLTALLALGAAVVVPGHGEPVDATFVTAQRDELAKLADCAGQCATENTEHTQRSLAPPSTRRRPGPRWPAPATAGCPRSVYHNMDAADDEGGLGCAG